MDQEKGVKRIVASLWHDLRNTPQAHSVRTVGGALSTLSGLLGFISYDAAFDTLCELFSEPDHSKPGGFPTWYMDGVSIVLRVYGHMHYVTLEP